MLRCARVRFGRVFDPPTVVFTGDADTRVMELKVWVDGVVRVVCGLTLDTSCKAVVIALAQSLGQTGRYLLVMKLHETERQLEANDCPLQLLAQLGQLSAQVQFTLQRTGPSLEHGPNTRPRERHRPGSRPTEPQSLQQRVPGKASRSSAHPRRNHLNRSWSPSPHVSSELRASPLSFLDQTSSKEEVFRHILQQEQRLRDLQVLLQSLDRDTALWELDSTSAPTPGPNPKLVERLEERLRQNEAELLLGEHWEGELEGVLRTAEQMLQDRQRTVEELNKELRQCKLQQFIQKSGGLPPDQNISQQTTNIYIINAGIVEFRTASGVMPRLPGQSGV
uniref:Ras association domain family member 7b n=1 Tax=Takifugu rubripes TaxID=31033 RepID=H2SPC5_TAKRU